MTTRDHLTRFNPALTTSLHEASRREHLSLVEGAKNENPINCRCRIVTGVMPFAALAQPASKTRKGVDIEPPRLEKILANTTSQPNGELAGWFQSSQKFLSGQSMR